MDVDYTKPRYVSVPEDYVAPKPEPTRQTRGLDLDSHPLGESYDSSCEGEFLGPEGMGKLFPQDQGDVASEELPLEGRVNSFAQWLKKR